MMEKNAAEFCENWSAHGHDLQTSFKILHNMFLVLAVNEDAALPSGCSIDASVHFVKELGTSLGIDFFNRTHVAFLLNDEIYVEALQVLKNKIGSGTISSSTPMINTTVKDVREFETKWIIPAGESWIKRYF